MGKNMNIRARHDLFMQRSHAVNPPVTTQEEAVTTLARIFRCSTTEPIERLLRAQQEQDHITALSIIGHLLMSDAFITELDVLP